ncbi:hypothetical protein CVT24_009728 [Panaeolus cyanescens]|uniref:Tyrosine specific protein phosphatases domain-containing protein n=1 Tax=Panaeolus cyanescens TaxID=181874 RepID=A0A409Y9C2_9AGAR|nr:hypothetical protein CVT24_009728 [Panaeolus cyanescens]
MQQLISSLASQHHKSDYNRSKYGLNGSPARYIPMSIHMPQQFYQLRAKQLNSACERQWWLSFTQPTQSHSIQDEIKAAMAEPLPAPALHPHPLKTSLTHPINVSFIIPQELVSLISSHALVTTYQYSPTRLDIPPPFALERLLDIRDIRIQQHAQKLGLCSIPQPLSSSHFLTRSNITNALQSAISSAIDPFIDAIKTPLPQPCERVLTTPLDSNLSLSLTMTTSLPNQPFQHVPARFSDSSITSEPPPFTLGNLLLSSCPGKKVRLTGPVKGRPGVCRDLELDLQRMRELGVRCIVCCLDDDELEFLGAPWSEYERYASKLGIDVLRLPIPEGLPPLSPSQLDAHIVDLINRYTLRGVPILVHCRGGVGRAGVVASCWMIRLGVCGWLENSSISTEEIVAAPRKDTVAYVQKVINLVRRRRSMKAIETYEQVLFLVDYVEYLRLNELRGQAEL